VALSQAGSPSITETLNGYMEAFNANELDRVMTFFAEDAVYRPGNGAERVGRVAIREELTPQFKLAFGAMRFDECDRVVDEQSARSGRRRP
jgi:ketosteroid isomerase-like protein